MPTALKLSKTPSTHGHRYSPKPKIKKAREFLMVHLYLLRSLICTLPFYKMNAAFVNEFLAKTKRLQFFCGN
jgi:hypothetical protein